MSEIRILRTTFFVTIILLGSKLSGFLRDVALAYRYGTSVESDAFVVAQSVLNLFAYVLFVALGIAFIPVYSKLKLADHRELNAFIDSTYSVAGTIIAVLCIIGFTFADGLVFLLAPGFPPEAHGMATWLTRIIMPAVLLTFLSTIQGQQLRGENIFLPSAFIAYPLNLTLIFALVFLAPIWDVQVAAYAYVFGSLLQVLLLIPFVRKTSYRFHYRFDLRQEGLRRILVLTVPIMLGNTLQAIDTLVNRILASGLAEGSMAALNYSNKLSIFLVGIVSLGAGTVCYTKMSELGARQEIDALKKFLGDIMLLLNFFMVPASLGMMALSVPITKLVFEYGAFDDRSCQMTAVTLWFYAIGLVGFVLRDIITRAFYALNDSKTPMINGGIAVIVSIIANIILVRFIGVGGLALATSISGILGTLLLIWSFRRKFGSLGSGKPLVTFLKICCASLVMAVSVHYLFGSLFERTGHLALSLILCILGGVLIYLASILLLRVKEANLVLQQFKKILKR